MGWGGSHFYKDVIPAIKKHLKVWASDTRLLPTHSTPTSASLVTYAVPSFVGVQHLRVLTPQTLLPERENIIVHPGNDVEGQEDEPQVSLEVHGGAELILP